MTDGNHCKPSCHVTEEPDAPGAPGVTVLAAAIGAALGTMLGTAGLAQAGPLGAQITAGSGQVTQSGNTTTIRQGSQDLSVNWQSFNVSAAETVNFLQPGPAAIAVNRVLGNGASSIFGHLNANGQVWFINPNGILFGRGSQLNVGGLVASTLDVADPAGGASTRTFSGPGDGRVVNQGSITAATGGYVALLGNGVSNQGTIAATLGTVALGGGSAATLTFAGNRLLQVQVDSSTLDTLAANSGLLAADGGAVFMTAGAKGSVLAASVNTTGVIRANTVENRGGTIVLSAGGSDGTAALGGSIDARGTAPGGAGGTITATATRVAIDAGARLDASGGRGGGSIDIGGGWQGGGGLPQATSVSVAPGAALTASATAQGNGGEIVVRSDVQNASSTTRVYGTLTAAGGPSGGDGGRIETSGAWLDVTGSRVDTSSPRGSAGDWLLDPQNVTIGASGTDLSGSGTITYVPTGTSTITASSIATALQGGTNVTITTGTTGGSLGDITVASAITKAAGNTDVTLTLQAADSIIVNAPISNTGGTGKLNVNLYADNDNGTHDGVGVVILYSGISTGGGTLNFGTGATATINGVANTLVGGDVYVGGSTPVTLATAGGNVNIYGQLIIGNPAGLNLDTTNGSSAGNVLFAGLVDSGDSYALVNNSMTWTQAEAAAKSGVGAAVGDTYLATITSRLENAVASYTAGYTASWLGGERVVGIGTDATWRWVTGPEGLTNGGLGLPFFTQNGSETVNGNGGTAINGAYTNWNSGEPNNYQGANLSPTGRNEWTMQFVGNQGQWNDLTGTGTSLPYMVETNLAPSPLNVNAGTAGTVTFANGLGENKPLLTLGVTGQIILLNNNSTTINTTGSTTLNGQVQLNGNDVNVLTVTAPSLTTTYGATLPSTFTPTYSGFLHGDTVASLTSPATATTTGTTAAVSTAPITATGAVDPNYLILYDPGTLIVDPAPVTVSGTTVTTKVYDGTTAATLSGGTLAGVFTADQTHVTLTQAGTFLSKDAGTSIGVTVADTLGGTAAADYTLTQPTGVTGTITPKPLSVNGSAVTNRVYDGSVAATLSGGSLVGVLGADVGHVSLSQSGTFASKDVGTGIAVTANDALSGTAAGDYSVTQPLGLTGSISALGLTVSGSTVGSKVYDGSFAAPVSGGTLVGVVPADAGAVGLTQTGTFTSRNVGTNIAVTAADTLTGAAAGDYTLTQPGGLSGSITPLGLSVSGTVVAGKTYDGTLAAALSGGALVGVVAGDAGAVNLTQSGSFASKDAGLNIAVTAADTLTGAAAGNYSLSQPTGLAASITPLSITVSGSAAGSKAYDGTFAAPVSGGSLVGVLPIDASGVALVQSGLFASLHAGSNIAVTATDTLTGAAAQDYALVQPGGLSGTITPLAVTVNGTTVGTKVYDGGFAAPVGGGTLVGVLAADAGNLGLSQTGSFASKNAGSNIAVTATDSLTGSAAGDYSVIQPTGLVGSITPLAITASGSVAGSKTYDGNTTAPVSGGALVGLLAGDVGAVTLNQSGSFSSLDAGTQIPVTVTDSLGGAAAGNYSLVQPRGLTGTITPARLTLAGTPVTATKTYDGTTVASTSGATLDGVLAGDSGSVYLVTNFASANAGRNIAVLPSLGGTLAGNYVVTDPSGGLTGNISPAPLLATAYPRALTVGGSLPPLAGTFSGFIAGQSLTGLQASGYRATWTTSAGSGSPAGQYAVVGAFSDPNYVVSQAVSNSAALTDAVPPPSNATTAATALSAAGGASGVFGAAETAGAAGAGTLPGVGGVAGTSGAPGTAGTAVRSADQPELTPFGGRRLIVVSGGVNTGTNGVAAHE